MGEETQITCGRGEPALHRVCMNAYSRGMSNEQTAPWPDKPLIRITRGRSKDASVKDILARKAYSGGVYIEVGERVATSLEDASATASNPGRR